MKLYDVRKTLGVFRLCKKFLFVKGFGIASKDGSSCPYNVEFETALMLPSQCSTNYNKNPFLNFIVT